jgi:hypothetical protein
VPWRLSDVLIGFAPFLLLTVAAMLIGPRSPLAVASHRLWIPLTLLTQLWMLAVTFWIARARKVHLVRRLHPHALFIEALYALFALPVVFAAMIAVATTVMNLFPRMGSPSAPWAPLAGSFSLGT